MTNKKLVSLYSGMGGSTLGFLQNGYEVHKAYDNDPEVHKTWKVNAHIGLVNHFLTDLTHEEYKDAVHVDTLIASPMCSTSSPINPKAKEKSGDAMAALSIIRAVEAYTPDRFVLDSINQYPTVCCESWSILLNGLTNNGYFFDLWRLNAKDYGLPQYRKRLFLVARKGSLTGWRIPQKDAQGLGWYKSIEDLVPSLSTFELKTSKSNKIDIKIKEAETKNEPSPWYLLAHFGAQSSWRPRPVWDVTPTIKALKKSRGGLGQLILVNRKNLTVGYRLTPQAYARFQGIPGEYILPTKPGYVAAYQIGNAVPTPLMSEIAKAIDNLL